MRKKLKDTRYQMDRSLYSIVGEYRETILVGAGGES
jgi:hypothetical protein